jgi:hypothetical protein
VLPKKQTNSRALIQFASRGFPLALFAMDVVQCAKYKSYKSACEDSILPYPRLFGDISATDSTVAARSVMTGSSVYSNDGFRRVSAGMDS